MCVILWAKKKGMGKYREKVDPTAEGLDELDESTRNATIERLIAGIQCKRTKPEKLMELTQHFRNRQSIEEKELYRLGDMSDDDKNMLPLKRISFLGSNE